MHISKERIGIATIWKIVMNLSPDQIQGRVDHVGLAIDECRFEQNEKEANSPQS
jgi:hypothetical protein